MTGALAHIVDAPGVAPIEWSVMGLWVVVGLFTAALALQHLRVKHGQLHVSMLIRPIALLGLAGLVVTAAPSNATSLETDVPVGLPDLISEPPIIWFDKEVEADDGSMIKVIAFDGYLHNVGEGVLDLFGNPQEPDGVKQRWFDGEQWVEVASPRVIYETTDDHNHFHLMAAAEYELWNEARTEKVGDSAKVGFCLLDTEQISDELDSFYDIDTFNYCEQDNPESTELRMGITPGWVDTYDANTTLQWVDVSNVRPGRYWVGAIMDPEDQVVESDEDNNGLVFSRNHYAVTGWAARALPVQLSGEPIRLSATGYGTAGPLVFEITEPPANGSLSVPSGFDLLDAEVIYEPDSGFSGTDSFRYIAKDLHSRYPLVPAEIEVEIEVEANRVSGDGGSEATDRGSITISGPSATIDARLTEAMEPVTISADNDDVTWFAQGLPRGLSIDAENGTISGVPTEAGEGEATVAAWAVGEIVDEVVVPWTVREATVDERGSLDDRTAFSSPRGERVNLYLGAGSDGASYSATGLPEGVRMVENIPLISGDPSESGTFDVTVVEMIDDGEAATLSFEWTIRPGPYPEFPL